MKRSFTLVELIFVIVVIGILAAVIIPRLGTSNLQKASEIFINTIRYTQHLAMIDDKYVPSKELSSYPSDIQRKKDARQWFKKWWTFQVWHPIPSYTASCDRSGPGLIVFSDTPSTGDNYEFNAMASKGECARDPQDKEPIAVCISESNYVNDKYNLQRRFGIEKVVIETPCQSLKNYVAFDELGRPHCMYSKGNSDLTPYKHLLKSKIKYTLCTDSGCEENISICVNPRTGFTSTCD